jgi:hyaluronan synthase
MFNEDPKLLSAQVDSILDQSKQFDEVFYIDDGSADKTGADFIEKTAKKHAFIKLIKLNKNVGKRMAQSHAIPLVKTDYIMTTDSDSILSRECLKCLLMPFFTDRKKECGVSAVTGKVLAYNESTNYLTSILNMRYYNAFDCERASQSVTGSVLVASGPSSIYKTQMIKDNLEYYKTQKFLGQAQTFGDDRCLTNIALRYGKVLYQSSALVLTEIPDNLRSFRKQQTRWSRSFFRESILGFGQHIKNGRPIAAAWIAMELIMFVAILASLCINIFYMFVPGYLGYELLAFFGFIIVNSLIRNIYYATVSFGDYWKAPSYGFIHMFVVIPVKLYALFTLKKLSWETRENIS